jgi:hypothetical protein
MTTEHGIRETDMATEGGVNEQAPTTGNGVGEPGVGETAMGERHGAARDTHEGTGRMSDLGGAEAHNDAPSSDAPSNDAASAHADGTVVGAGAGAGGKAADRGQSPSLIAPDRAVGFQKRWDELKGDFVDDPRRTVQQIDGLVGDVLDELEQVFRRQRGDLEAGTSDEGSSTEDLRVAFGRYREFFDRLLKV